MAHENQWTLTEDELEQVERGHRDMMALEGRETAPLRMSLDGVHLRAQAEAVAAELIDIYGPSFAEGYFAGAFRAAQADSAVRMALQVGTTRNINGVNYILNQNHRWTRQTHDTPHPDVRVHQTNTYNGQSKYSAIHADGTVLATHSTPEEAAGAAIPQMQQRQQEGHQFRTPGKAPQNAVPFHQVNVEGDENHDGITDSARVGVPAFWVPPPPKKIPRIPGLSGAAQVAEHDFATEFEKGPAKIIKKARTLFEALAKPGEPVTFETDKAKNLSKHWNSPQLEKDLQARSQNRATLNTALHQTANAITKRAFVEHLDTLPEGSEILVTVGGCGAGKGYAMGVNKETGQPFVPDAHALKQRASVVWDSAGDQNATENPWILQEATKRGLKVAYVYVHADPHTQWAHPERGVVKRAQDPNDGRMVDAKVFADSYALGAKNHHAFYERNKNNPNCTFLFLKNGNPPEQLPGIPTEALQLDRKELANFAINTVRAHDKIPNHVRDGALQGTQLWHD